MISQKSGRSGTVVTICNWRTYQDDEAERGQKTGGKRAEDDHPSGHYRRKERREEGKKREGDFVPPTRDEVRIHCRRRGYTFDPELFVAHYGSQGWLKGNGQEITSWQDCCATFQAREGDFAGKATRQATREERNEAVIQQFLKENENGEYGRDREGSGDDDGQLVEGDHAINDAAVS
jgi:hypothetical protein